METDKPESKILKTLLKDIEAVSTVTSLATTIKMSRVGVWKALKRMESEKLVTLTPTGKGKTSTYIARLNWENSLLEKKLSLITSEDAVKQKRWQNNFADLEKEVDFLVLYGSILYSSKEANDIDILAITKNFDKIDKMINRVQTTQAKKIHILSFTQKEFAQELENKNKAVIDAVKKGIILFGQERFISFMKRKK